LFSRREWTQIDGAMCHIIERLEELGIIEYDVEMHGSAMIAGKKHVVAAEPVKEAYHA
jgi:hypothetical protein